MKHGELRAIAHNIADSLASGICLMIGVYDLHVFDEAAATPEGFIVVDFLRGTTSAEVSERLADAVRRYKDALPGLCERHGVPTSAFRELVARYEPRHHLDVRFVVSIEDQAGRRSTDEYVGIPGARPMVMDALGRRRRARRAGHARPPVSNQG
jgi:hypothetical protein